MIIKRGDEVKIENIWNEDEKPRICPKCKKKITMIKIDDELKPVCECEETDVENSD